jgi:hypothetical protein
MYIHMISTSSERRSCQKSKDRDYARYHRGPQNKKLPYVPRASIMIRGPAALPGKKRGLAAESSLKGVGRVAWPGSRVTVGRISSIEARPGPQLCEIDNERIKRLSLTNREKSRRRCPGKLEVELELARARGSYSYL